MTQVVCFSDSAAVISAVRQGLTAEEVVVHTLPASRLTDELRQMVRALTPDLFLLELSQAWTTRISTSSSAPTTPPATSQSS